MLSVLYKVYTVYYTQNTVQYELYSLLLIVDSV